MFQDGLDDLPVFDEADDSHDSPTLRAGQRIDFVDFLNEPRPVLPVFLRTLIDFQDAGDPISSVSFRFPRQTLLYFWQLLKIDKKDPCGRQDTTSLSLWGCK
jgi:hypothetical protein